MQNIPHATLKRTPKTRYAAELFIHGGEPTNFKPCRNWKKLASITGCSADSLRRAGEADDWEGYKSFQVAQVKLDQLNIHELSHHGVTLADWLHAKMESTKKLIDSGELSFADEAVAYNRLDRLTARWSKVSGYDAITGARAAFLKEESKRMHKTENEEIGEPDTIEIRLREGYQIKTSNTI